LAMDNEHLQWMQRHCPANMQERLKLFLDFSPRHAGEDVPDPYYGGDAGFEHVLNLVEDAVTGLIASLKR
jgi:protein-tyrosine phosphatase